jgi:pyruvate carboxylase
MYPKVFADFVKTQDKYGPTEVLPTPVYFYGLKPKARSSSSISRRARRWCCLSGPHRDQREGQVRVFFDLNGQPRTITVPDRLKVGDVQGAPRRRSATAKQVGAPMPGVISGLGVKVGDKVFAGDVLLLDRGDEDGNRHPRRSRRRRRRSLVSR